MCVHKCVRVCEREMSSYTHDDELEESVGPPSADLQVRRSTPVYLGGPLQLSCYSLRGDSGEKKWQVLWLTSAGPDLNYLSSFPTRLSSWPGSSLLHIEPGTAALTPTSYKRAQQGRAGPSPETLSGGHPAVLAPLSPLWEQQSPGCSWAWIPQAPSLCTYVWIASSIWMAPL